MDKPYISHHGMLHVPYEWLDHSVWVTIPEMARRMRLKTNEAAELLQLLGLRWKGPNDCYSSKVPTKLAADQQYAISVEGTHDTQDLIRWNYPNIRALMTRITNHKGI